MKKHIVVIEDDPQLLAVIAFLLDEAGYRVTGMPAISTVEGLIGLNADCFLIDEQLPLVSGHIIAIMLGTKRETKDKPVILMSASAELESKADLCQAFATIKKPFHDSEQLLSLVAKTIHTAECFQKLRKAS